MRFGLTAHLRIYGRRRRPMRFSPRAPLWQDRAVMELPS
jgi:hypothetical protein